MYPTHADMSQIDFSKELISWVTKEKYALLDVNVFPRPFASPLPVRMLMIMS